MKLFVISALFFATVLAELRPIYEFEEWWALRDFEAPAWLHSRFRGGRVIGGQEATRHQFPYQAGLRLNIPGNANQGTCGGSLVSRTRVVTAAHCVDIVSSAVVVLGAHLILQQEPNQIRQTIPSAGLIWHENYNSANLNNDVAIINLNSEITPSNFIRPINLPTGADLNNNFAGHLATASGWGRFSSANVISEFLRFVQLNVITEAACRIRFPTIIQPSTICTAGSAANGNNVGVCNGDSGGPLTIQRQDQSVLIGIASFVSGLGCESGWPSGFARVTSFVPWFNARM